MIPGSANPLLLAAAEEAGAYEISRSVRLNSSDSAYFSRTPSVAGNRKTWTWAGWVKRTVIGATQALFGNYTDGSNFSAIRIINDYVQFVNYGSGGTNPNVTTPNLLRDPSAWYHIVLALDTTQTTSSNRVRVYINGVELTTSGAYPDQNSDLRVNTASLQQNLGAYTDSGGTGLDGYLAEVHFIDGQALDPTSFGEFDTNGVWQPIEYTGTYGTNGFHLPFSDNSTAAALGTDTSGNGNDWTPNNLSIGGVVYSNYFAILPVGSTLPFDSTYFSTYVNTSTGAIIDAAWAGAYRSSGDVIWTPPAPIPVISSIDVYGGSYNNAEIAYTITVTYTDSSTSTLSGTSGSSNWVGRLSASVPGKNIQSISVTSSSYAHLAAVRVDGTFLVDGDPPPNNDSLVDTPTNGSQTDTGVGGEVVGNYATLNPLAIFGGTNATKSYGNGNLEMTATSSNNLPTAVGTIAPSSGKWYAEVTAGHATNGIGFINVANLRNILESSWSLGQTSDGWIRWDYRLFNNASVAQTGLTSIVAGDIVQIALDLDNGKAWFGINNTWDSGSPSAGTSPTATFTAAGKEWVIGTGFRNDGVSVTATINFGQRPFAYTAPSGYKALCTANLDDPLVAQPSTVMDVALYTGNGSTQTISGLGFSPDLVWGKRRSGTASHVWMDTIRGTGVYLRSDTTNAESANVNVITSFDSDGFTLGTSSALNLSGSTYVAWTWDAGSSTVSNTDGSITSTVRANPSAGFSIVSYTANGTVSTIGHGLNAAPQFIVGKSRDGAYNWMVGHEGIGWTKFINLNLTNGTTTSINGFNNTAPTSSVFTIGSNNNQLNTNGANYIAYCFAPVDGYSSFGSYTGNGSTDGPFVYTGFRPRWILTKVSSTTAYDWMVYDTERDTYNTADKFLVPNYAGAEQVESGGTTITTSDIDILSNGFKFRTNYLDINRSGETYIYAAFAEHPFKTARAR